MGDEKKTDHIPFGEPVVISKPTKDQPRGREGCAAPLVVVFGLIGIMLALGLLSEPSSTPTSAPVPVVEPAGGATPTASLVPTYAPGLPTPTTPPIYGIQGTTFDCQPGIGVGKTVVVVADSVRMRQSPGYVGKNDATDTVYLLGEGDQVNVKGGPLEIDGLCWWNVEYTGLEGWAADHSPAGTPLLLPVQ